MIYVVTAVHDRYRITEKFVENLLRQTCSDIHLLLIDDGSTDGTDRMVKAKMPQSTVLYGDGNLWWGGALHKAYKWLMKNASDEDAVMISNDDTAFSTDYVSIGVGLLRENRLVVGSGYGMYSGVIRDGLFQHSFVDGTGQLLPLGSEGNCASTRSLFLTVGQWRKIGGLHPVLLPHYFSDFEFTIRAWRKGYTLQSFEGLTYQFDEGATGHNSYETLSLKKLFSKRSGLNPFYRLSFIVLTTPVKYLPSHIAHQMMRYFKKLPVFRDIIKRG